jgi:hypothetical protein
MLGDEITKAAGVLDRNTAAQRVKKISEDFQLAVHP